jgi:hypothetical protein
MLANLSRPSRNGYTFYPDAPYSEVSERPPSNVSAFETAMEARMNHMETRMSRMEAMIEALVQDRGLVSTPLESIEYSSRSGPRRSVTTFADPAIDPMLAQMQHQLPHHTNALAADGATVIRTGDHELPFSGPDHERYPMPDA